MSLSYIIFREMKDKTNRYSRKPKKRLRDIFHKNKTLVQPLEEEISKPRHESL